MAQRQVFISYARSDNETLPGNSKGFVTNVVDEMETIFQMKYPKGNRLAFYNTSDHPLDDPQILLNVS
jgi:hypothetical protein